MLIKDVVVEYPPAMSEEEAAGYVEEEIRLWDAKGKRLARVVIEAEDDEAVIRSFERSPIRRVRRITGYLSEVSNFNDAKQAELKARIAHKF